MKRKIYARQVNPAYSGEVIGDIFKYDEVFQNITVFGNRDFYCRKTAIFERVYEVLNSGVLTEALANIGESFSWYSNATEAINDYLYRDDGKKYSFKDIHDLKNLVEEYSTCDCENENRIICTVLSIVSRQKYDYTTIRGCCQGDWNEIFYPVEEYSVVDIHRFEAYYFNTGSEWIIHDGEKDPESPEDIDGYSYYCTTYDIRKEIAEVEGVDPADVILYEYHEKLTPYYLAV